MAGFLGEVRTSSEIVYTSPENFAIPLKRHAPPLGKVSMIDQSENLTFLVA
jgi:hypothetical protein